MKIFMWPMFSEPRYVFVYNTQWYLDLWILYIIFLDARVLQPFMKMYVFNLKHWSLFCIQVYNLLTTCLKNVLHLVSFKLAKQKNNLQNHISSTFFLQINAQFLVNSWFEVAKFMSHVFSLKMTYIWPSNSLWLQPAFFMHLNYNIIKKHFLMDI